ncbi:MAG: FHA domain-containing protein [Phycisphaerae bacterium]
MSQDHAPDPNSPICITEAEAHDSHVDDLLRRQASLRGEPGITRDSGRKWYYQNWFVLMLAGLIAAIVGWALVEPLITDMPYIEGTIKDIRKPDGAGLPGVLGQLAVGDQHYLLISGSRWRGADGKWNKITPNWQDDVLQVGARVGIYVEVPEDQPPGAKPLLFAAYIIPNAPPSKVGDDLLAVNRTRMLGFWLLFPAVAGLVGLLIGAADGLMCRLPRRALLAGGIGLLIGLFGGVVSTVLANIIYAPIHHWAMGHEGAGVAGLTTTGFLMQVGARAVGWALAGMAMGLGQGLALRSGKIVMYGFLGGLLGGLFGGILFDPIFFMISGAGSPSAAMSRMVSLAVIGAVVGFMIGIVELLARDAWLRMVAGPLAGKEFLIFKATMQVGASPKSDIYLFNDAGVAQTHATIRSTGDLYEIENASDVYPLTVNGRVVQRCRLRHGDQIGLGRTIFAFQRKRG